MDDVRVPVLRPRTRLAVAVVLVLVWLALRGVLTGSADLSGGAANSYVGTGAHAWMNVQPGTGEPVGYDPCVPIGYVVNHEDAPGNYFQVLTDAVAEISEASGLTFAYRGPTTATDPTQLELAGGPLLLVRWADEVQDPGLARDVAGLGGSGYVTRPSGRRVYVVGRISLDVDYYRRLAARGDVDEERAILLHELGHVVGLAHVDDRAELMNDDNIGRTVLGVGDRKGLATLGALPCGG